MISGIIQLDHRIREVADEIDRIQKKSYKIEASLLGYDRIPYLLHDFRKIMEANEVFLGFMKEDVLAGLLSYDNMGFGVLDICRLAVLPEYFGKGVATKLVSEVEKRESGYKKIFVQTASGNQPAVNLYRKLGYLVFREFVTTDGLPIIRFLKEPDIQPAIT